MAGGSAAFAVRAVLVEPREVGVYEAEAGGGGLDAWLGRSGPRVRVVLHVYRVERLGLLVQRLPGDSVEAVWGPVLEAWAAGRRLCRFHWGPLGRPVEQRYCTREAVEPGGFCAAHRSSWMALYERCAAGSDSACVAAARLLAGQRFAVYVLDYGGSRVKAGMTQEWRLLWRIAEQPHVAAAAVYRGGLLEARRMERSLGRHPAATEGSAARLEKRLREAARGAAAVAAGRGEEAARRLAGRLSVLGMEGVYEAYAVLPRSGDPSWALELPRLGLGELLGGAVRVVDYWAGLLLVEAGGRRGVVDKRELQHVELRGRWGQG